MDSKEKERYARMQLKNGWDLPPGEKPPLTGRRQEMVRAYELLVLRSDEELAGRIPSDPEPVSRQSAVDAAEAAVDRKKTAVSEGTQPESAETPEKISMISSEDYRRRRRKKILTAVAAAAVLIAAAVLRFAFGPAILLADISTYKDVEVEIEGLKDEPFTVTIGEIAKMKKKKIHVDVHEQELAEGEEPERGDAVGPTLETFLRKYGKTVDDFRSMRVYAGNDNSKAYVRTMKEKTVILSVANGRRPLGEKQAPLRIAVEGEDVSEWSGWIRKIVFTQ